MCGRYVFRHNNKENPLEDSSYRDAWHAIQLPVPRYNIAPSQLAPVITSSGVKQMAFGMHPSWSKSSLINAKTENLVSSRFWKPLADSHPCLIPADGFYEPLGEKGTQRPWYGFEFEDSKPFLMPGIFTKQDDVNHFVILTKPPNKVLEPIHSRMPVLLTRYQSDVMDTWLNTSLDLTKRTESISTHLEFDDLLCFPVDDRVKNPRNEGPELFEKALSLF